MLLLSRRTRRIFRRWHICTLFVCLFVCLFTEGLTTQWRHFGHLACHVVQTYDVTMIPGVLLLLLAGSAMIPGIHLYSRYSCVCRIVIMWRMTISELWCAVGLWSTGLRVGGGGNTRNYCYSYCYCYLSGGPQANDHSNLTYGCIAAFRLYSPGGANVHCLSNTTWFLMPTLVCIPNDILVGSTILQDSLKCPAHTVTTERATCVATGRTYAMLLRCCLKLAVSVVTGTLKASWIRLGI